MPGARIAIIGGGPSGIVTLKTLLEWSERCQGRFPIDEIAIFEAEDKIGGTFRYRAYANANLVSSKQLTAFSDFRLPLDAPDHLSLPRYVAYLEDYVAHFKLQEQSNVTWRFKTRVAKVQRSKNDDGVEGHLVSWGPASADGSHGASKEQAWFTHVAVCSGLHVTPSWPDVAGLPPPRESIKEGEEEQKLGGLTEAQRRIQTVHSSAYKEPSIYKGKKVMILGTGETGMDMAYEAVKARAEEIVLCTRSGFLSFPAVLENFSVLGVTYDKQTPIDGLITNLFESSYVHPWVAQSHLRWHVSDIGIKNVVLPILTGTRAGCNQWIGELPEERLGRAYTFLNKSGKAMPYCNRGWRKRSPIMEAFAKYLDPPTVTDDEPSVDVAPFPLSVSRDGTVVFDPKRKKEYERIKTRKIQPDVVVYATGYKHEFKFLDESYPTAAQATCRDVFKPDDPTVAFIGFVRPGVGAIPPQAEMSAQLWSMVISGDLAPPTSPVHYHLLGNERPGARIRHGVDYSSYVSQLARDMNSAPALGELLRRHGLFVLFIYCFAAAFPTLYRLNGPWAKPEAAEIAKTEIFETIQRRGVGGNILMGVIPMLFYAAVNALAIVLEGALSVARVFAPDTCDWIIRSVGAQDIVYPHPQAVVNGKPIMNGSK